MLKAVEAGHLDFVLLDTRGPEAYAAGHIPGAWCTTASPEDVDRVARRLLRDREVVTYCWGHD